ncbi:MAG: LysM peptidoglycan-binding domain-containing protein, partial [Bacteroidota bacterium]|nr:LysM peptidoglycan-binding domain-containing protein [Bacteroidota bacterium]
IAATLIAMDPARYGFTNIQYESPVAYDTVYVHEAVDLNALGNAAGVSGIEIKNLNPELLQPSTPPVEICGPEGYCLKIPAGAVKKFGERFARLTPEEKRPWLIHTVERGESLRSIARTYGLSLDQLADYNNLDASERVKRGTRLRVPMTVMAPATIASNDSTTPSKDQSPLPLVSKGKKIAHRVKRGETLNSIAAHYGVRVSDLRNWNNISYRKKIKRGQLLAVYLDRPAKKTVDSNLAEKPVQTKTAPAPIAETHSGTPRIHAVRPGETLTSIARNYGTTVDQLAEWNDGIDGASLQAGQKLKLYAPNKTASKGDTDAPVHSKLHKKKYRVRRGDTLYSIAERFGVDVHSIKSVNGLHSNSIQKGKSLVIPAE